MIHHPQNERCTLVPQLVYCLDYFKIRKGCQKKTFMFFYYTGGGGVGEAGGSARVVKKPHWFVKEKLFQRACRIILGPQKHVLHLVCSVLGISTAIKTTLKGALYDFFDGPPAPLNSQLMEKVNHYNCTKKIDFSMGPSVKFVLAIIDSISQKNGG